MNKYLLFLGAWYQALRRGMPDFKTVLAVSAHESAVWTSSLWLRANNGFGMRVPKVRPNVVDFETQEGNSNLSYAGYRNGWRSVKDFFLWLDYNNYNYSDNTLEKLVNFQKNKGYFGDTFENYYRGSKYHYDNNLGFIGNFFFLIKLIFIPTIILIVWNRKKILNYLRKIIK